MKIDEMIVEFKVVHSCVYTVVSLVRVHSGITSACAHSGITSACTQWYH